MKEQNRILDSSFWYFFTAVILFSYCTIKAVSLSITWDEAYTYYHFIRHEIFVQEQVESMSANNHWLNNWLCIFFIRIFGFKIWILRLPALIGCLLHLVYSRKIILKVSSGFAALAAFVLVNAHPYLLDFFSLSRGYGLSIGCMTASLFFLIEYFESYRKKSGILFLLFMMLSILASFVLLSLSLILLGFFVLQVFIPAAEKSDLTAGNSKKFLRQFFLPLLACSPLILYVIHYSFQLKTAGALYFGGKNGIIENTLVSLYEVLLYEGQKLMVFQTAGSVMMLLLLTVSLYFGIRNLTQKQKEANFTLLIISAATLLCLLGSQLQWWILETPMPMYRTALFLMVLVLFSLAALLLHFKSANKTAGILLYALAAISMLHFIKKANFSYVLEWKKDYAATEAVKLLKPEIEGYKGPYCVSIGTGEDHFTLFNFYRDYWNLNHLLSIHPPKKDHPLHDYYFCARGEKKQGKNLVLLQKFMEGDFELWRNTQTKTGGREIYHDSLAWETKKGELLSGKILQKETEFSETFNVGLDSLKRGKNIMVELSGNFSAINPKQSNVFMVISHEKPGGVIDYSASPLCDLLEEKNEWKKIKHCFYLSENPEQGEFVKAFLYNPDQHSLLYQNLEIKIIDFDRVKN